MLDAMRVAPGPCPVRKPTALLGAGADLGVAGEYRQAPAILEIPDPQSFVLEAGDGVT